jgi:tetratricopeptide (TPR) repeat protein
MSTPPKPPPPPVELDLEPTMSERSAVLDLSDLAYELEDFESGGQPPSLVDEPSSLWGFASGMYSDLLTTASPGDADSWQRLAEEFAAESTVASDPEVRGVLACEAGRVLFDRLGRMEEGELLMRNSGSPVAETLLGLSREGFDSLADTLAALEATARDQQIDPATRAAAWTEFGIMCEHKAGDPNRALEAYGEAMQLVPDDPLSAGLAAEVALTLDEQDRARALLEARLERTEHPQLQVATLVDLAELAQDPTERRALLERAHSADRAEETALRRLIRVVAEMDDRETLSKLYRELARISEDPYSVSTALHLAFLTAIEAGENPAALVSELTEIVQHAAGEQKELLAPLIEVALHLEQRMAAGEDEGLTKDLELLSRVADGLDAPRERAVMRLQMARLQLEGIKEELPSPTPPSHELDPAIAARCDAVADDLRYCLEHLPQDHWIFDALAFLFELRGQTDELAIHLQAWARVHAAGPGRAEVLVRLGRTHEELRRDLPRAAEVYELALAEDPDDQQALRALGRVYEKMHRWPQAINNLQRQARQANDEPERLRALRRAANMAQHELHDPELAVATLEEVARLAPDDLLSLYQLAALARTQNRAQVMVETLRTLVERLDDPVAQTTTLVELGEVLELQLKRRGEAREAYEQALKLSPGYGPALRALGRIYRDEGDLEALLAMHEPEMDSVTDPAVLALKAARICQDELGDLDRALEYLRRSYNSNPDLVPARELLFQLLLAAGHVREAYDLLRAQDDPKTPGLRADRHYHLGLLAEALGRAASGAEATELSDAALQHHRTALREQPQHGLAFERCRRILIANNDAPNLIELLRTSADSNQGADRARLLVQVARICTTMPEGFNEARRALELAVEADPRDPLVRRELEGLLRQAGDTDSLPSVYLAAARNCEDPHFKATLLVESAELLLRSNDEGDRRLAGEAVLGALREDPGNPYAVRHLERLLAEPNPPVAASEAVAARAVRAQSDAERAIFYLESAELLEHAGVFSQARRAYEAALAAIPELLPAKLGIQRVHGRREVEVPVEAPAPARESLHTLMAEARDAAARAGASANADDGARALELLRKILAREPNHRDAIALARALVSQLPDPAPALALLSSVHERVSEPQQRYDLGLLLAEQAADLEESVRLLLVAHNAMPDGREALRRLVDGYRRLGHDANAAKATERLIALYDPSDPASLDLRLGLAHYLARDPDGLGRALKHAQMVHDARPDDLRTIDLMATLLERDNQAARAAEFLETLVARERDRNALHSLHLRRAQLLASLGGRAPAALEAASAALSLRPGHRDTVKVFAAAAQTAGQSEALAEHLPRIRAALMRKVSRGAVSIRDLQSLAQVASSVSPDLARSAAALVYAFEPSKLAPPSDHLRPISKKYLAALLGDESRRTLLIAPEEAGGVHQLLGIVEPALSRLTSEFISLDGGDLVPVPPQADPAVIAPTTEAWAASVGVANPIPHGAAAHNACVFLPGNPPVLRIGNNLWMQGEVSAWRGLAALSLARRAWGAPLARSMTPIELDLLLAGCFEAVGVFNAITADPDPRRLGPLTTSLARNLPRRARRQVEEVCNNLSGIDLVPSATAKATLATDFRLAIVLTGDVSGCISAACLLDGVAGGSLKQRVNRSSTAQRLVNFVLSDAFAELRGTP